MKKILCIAFSLVMMLSLCLSVAAADITPSTNTDGVADDPAKLEDNVVINVKAAADSDEDVEKVYSVVIHWTDLTFTYSGTWNPEELEYTDGDWDKTSADLSVENRSNATVHVAADLLNVDTTKNVTVELSQTAFDLATAVGSTTNGPTETVTLTIDGVPSVTEGFTLATVKFTITTD